MSEEIPFVATPLGPEPKTVGQKVGAHLAWYWLDYVIFCCLAFSTLAAVIIAALQGVEWKNLTGQPKFLIILGILQAEATTVLAYAKQIRSRVRSGKDPFDSGDSNPEAFRKP